MAYHETFWVAVTATAPVIALAATVSFSDILRLIDVGRGANKSPGSKREPGTMYVAWASLLCTANMAAQLVFLLIALMSIAKGSDKGRGFDFIVWGEPVGIALLLVVAAINTAARIEIKKAEKAGNATTEDDGS
jgi:hypothetical protein